MKGLFGGDDDDAGGLFGKPKAAAVPITSGTAVPPVPPKKSMSGLFGDDDDDSSSLFGSSKSGTSKPMSAPTAVPPVPPKPPVSSALFGDDSSDLFGAPKQAAISPAIGDNIS